MYIVTLHIFVLSFSDDLEVLNAAIAKFKEKSFVQTLQEEDKMAPGQFQN